jgi:hypothetical protein
LPAQLQCGSVLVRFPSFVQFQPSSSEQDLEQVAKYLSFLKHVMPPPLLWPLQHFVFVQSSPGAEQGSSSQYPAGRQMHCAPDPQPPASENVQQPAAHESPLWTHRSLFSLDVQFGAFP